jgi:hypothetical protein
MACDNLITADILNDCDNSSIGGLETNVLLINANDIDRSATTFDATNKTLMTNFALLAGKTGYLLEGVKQVNSFNWELVKKERTTDKFKHVFTGVILNPTAVNKEQLRNMAQGGKFIVVLEQKWKGVDNDEAFAVLGYGSGLELMTSTRSSAENDGTIGFTLESVEGYEETTTDVTLLETDYTTTKASFLAKFAS